MPISVDGWTDELMVGWMDGILAVPWLFGSVNGCFGGITIDWQCHSLLMEEWCRMV